MSGIVGILSADGRPVDTERLRHMTEVMRSYGPDAETTWASGRAGFGHALLRTTSAAADDCQLVGLDERLWIVADARIDGQRELRSKLAARGRAGPDSASDAELVLWAYAEWGEACVDHLLGDFAFAIWDSAEERLFCARDHFGVKPFYYALTGDHLIFSNVLRCLRAWPGLSDRLNDQVVADFLLFGQNQAFDTTIYAAIGRLPPAHTLVWTPGQAPRLRRYWSLPAEGSTRYKRKEEYVEHFQELLRRAVGDRLRTRQVGVYMSGGLDSTSVAATARELLAEEPSPFDLHAYTFVADNLFPDDREGHYAGVVTEFLGMTHHRIPAEGYKLYGGPENPVLLMPEPVDLPLWAAVVDQARAAAEHGRVIFTGQGGDPAFYPSRFYLYELLRKGRIKPFLTDVGDYLSLYRRLPPLYLRMIAGGARGGILPRSETYVTYPPWFNPAFAEAMKLRERWDAYHAAIGERPPNAHPARPEASQNLSAPLWSHVFEHYYQASALGVPVEVRHPLFDIRLLSFLMTLPPVPWFVDKTLPRLAMKDRLPESIRTRGKAPAAGDLIPGLLRREDGLGEIPFDSYPELEYYIDQEQFLRIVQMRAQLRSRESQLITRPLSLLYWLNSNEQFVQLEEQ